MVALLTREQMVAGLEAEISNLEERLGNARLALRAYKVDEKGEEAPVVEKQRRRAHLPHDVRRVYKDEIIAVLEAFGPSSVKQLMERGKFEGISDTTVYRLALEEPRVERNDEKGRNIQFKLK